VIRRHEPLSPADAIERVQSYLLDMRKLADFVGDTTTRDRLTG
jgi:hypothetical protein